METTQARTVCTQEKFEFQGLGRRSVEADFSGGYLSSDGGGLLLREIGERTGLLARMEGCFTDLREPVLVEHPLRQLLAQRVFGLAQGYEDLNDHDRLRHWSRERRVVGMAAVTRGRFNPRFIVTDIPTDADWAADASGMFGEGAEGLYREFYRARGDMESERSGDDAPEG